MLEALDSGIHMQSNNDKQTFKTMSEYEQHNACVLNRNMQELRQLWQQSCA